MKTIKTLQDILHNIINRENRESFLHYDEANESKVLSSHQFYYSVLTIATFLQKHGLKEGNSFAIVSESSPYWLMVDFACQLLGVITVPIFSNISSKNLTYELTNADVKFIFIATQDKYNQIDFKLLKSFNFIMTKNILTQDNIDSFDINDILNEKVNSFSKTTIDENSIATIIYTSGSTGTPKGVEITHRNFATQVNDTANFFKLNENDKILTFLPLAHIFERMVIYFYINSLVEIHFVTDVKKVKEVAAVIKPTIMTAVPRLLEKIYRKMDDKLFNVPYPQKFITMSARYRANSKNPHTPNNFFDKLLDRLVYKKLTAALGGQLRMLICGGAPLSYQHNQFFLNIGLPLYQGYGLTESSPVVAANYPGNIKCGTVGLVYKSTEVKIADDLELLVRGCSVMRGYHKEVEKTQKTIDTYGWLHTGDLASLDNEGYLTLIGRKKELFKTSTGEYVTAIVIEQKVSTSRWIDYALIIADNRPFVTALIYPDYEVLLEYFEDKNIGDKQQNEMLNNFIERAIKNTNNTLNGWEKIRDYKIIEDIPTIEEGVLTPSMKLAREFVMKKYHDEISQMYCNSSN